MLHKHSRRSFLLGTCAIIGASLAGAGRADNSTGSNTVTHSANSLGFSGPDLVQLVLYDTKLEIPRPRDILPEDNLQWAPDYKSRRGGLATLNGESGVASGNRHATAPQLFRNWAAVQPGSQLEGFGEGRSAADDPLYWTVEVDGAPVPVLRVYRKTVPIRAAKTAGGVYVHEKRHLVTLKLRMPVPDGASVSVVSPAIGEMQQQRSDSVASETIHVCQEGYPTAGSKKGYVGLWLGHDAQGEAGTTDGALSQATEWSLISAESGETVASGVLQMAKPNTDPHRAGVNFNGCDVYVADFSQVSKPGTYRLEVSGVGASPEFPVSRNPYANALRLAARWYYHQRSGIAIEAPFGEGRSRPRNGHPADNLMVWQTNVKLGKSSEGYGGPYSPDLINRQDIGGVPARPGQPVAPGSPNPDAWGGWHDAGDWDRRVQHMDAVYQIAALVELFETSRTLDLNLPESGRTFADAAVGAKKNEQDTGDGKTVLPDLIHEALWGISLWRRTQTAQGGIIGGVEYSLDGIDGSVSWNPVQRAYAYAPEPWAAYRFTIAAAKLGHVIKTVCGDETLGNALIAEADLAWKWAEREWPELVSKSFAEDEDPTEGIPEKSVVSNIILARVAAAAVHYRASGEPTARAVFDAHNPFLPRSEKGSLNTRRGVYTYASFDYLSAAREGRDFDSNVVVAIFDWTVGRLNREKRMGSDYGLHSTSVYPWGRGWLRFGPGSNWRASDIGLEYSIGRSRTELIRRVVIEGMWFGLGCNPSNTTFIQGLGQRSFGNPTGLDFIGFDAIPGHIAFGVAGGRMHPWEKRRVKGQLYPAEQMDWPQYTQIFESSTVAICAEHGIKSNTMEWLFACAFANELLAKD